MLISIIKHIAVSPCLKAWYMVVKRHQFNASMFSCIDISEYSTSAKSPRACKRTSFVVVDKSGEQRAIGNVTLRLLHEPMLALW